MREKRGYWFDSKSLEVIPTHDHFDFLQDLEGKFRFEFATTPDEERWGRALGMKPVKGWGLDLRGKKGYVKRAFMLEALKRGWVRIRGHSDMPRMTIEFWKRSDGLLAALGVAVRKVAGADEVLELHEVSTDTPWLTSVRELMLLARGERAEGGELTGPAGPSMSELWSRTVEANKLPRRRNGGGGRRRGVVGVKVARNPGAPVRNNGSVPLVNGIFCYRTLGPGERFFGSIRRNPAKYQAMGRVSYARLLVGFRIGRAFEKKQPDGKEFVTLSDAKRVLLKYNKYGGALAGYSLVPQVGLYVPLEFKGRKTIRASEVSRLDEPGAQVVLYREPGENWRQYFKRINRVGYQLLRNLDQEMVIVEAVIEGRFLTTAAWVWTRGKASKRSSAASAVPFAEMASDAGVALEE